MKAALATVLEERGIFWWHDEPVPHDCFAPASSVPGLLHIASDGTITLDLDGYLTSDKGAWSVLDHDACKGKQIQGKLRVTDRHVLLLELSTNGGRVSTNGQSYVGYRALHCLSASELITGDAADFRFDNLKIDLIGLEDWLQLANSKVSLDGEEVSITHKNPPSRCYNITAGTCQLRYFHIGAGLDWSGSKRCVEIFDRAALDFIAETPTDLATMHKRFLAFDDLFTILTDSPYNLVWPRIRCVGAQTVDFDWYFRRFTSGEPPPEKHEMPTNFPQLQDDFGSIVDSWLQKRDRFGPGFYLYLGTRRGMQIYAEHEFASLVWGLEALHRKKVDDDESASKIKEKVDRILGSVMDNDDKRWLRARLARAHEPALENRIFTLLSTIPLSGVDRNALRTFATKCANMRNDISHFGSNRHGSDYEAFQTDLRKYVAALSKLYHALLLFEIGVSTEHINRWFFQGYSSYGTISLFRDLALLSDEK